MAFITGTFDVRPREILLNVDYGGFSFSDEFHKYVEEKNPIVAELLIPMIDEGLGYDTPDVRTNPDLIALAKEFGVSRVAGEYSGIVIKKIPEFYTWNVTEYDGAETLHVEFPWKDFAIALATNDEANPLVQVHRNGVLVGIEEGNPRFLSLAEWERTQEVDHTEWGGEGRKEDRE